MGSMISCESNGSQPWFSVAELALRGLFDFEIATTNTLVNLVGGSVREHRTQETIRGKSTGQVVWFLNYTIYFPQIAKCLVNFVTAPPDLPPYVVPTRI